MRRRLSALRVWVQDHGEKAAILGFALGMLIILFFRVFVLLVAVGIIAVYIVWFIAPADE